MMGSMNIGEVARWAGVRPSTLRYYEGVGLLPSPERTNGRRRYDGEVLREVLDRLTIVRVAQQAGFTISEIRTLLDGFSEDTPPSERWRVLAREKLTEVDALIERALGMKDLLERGLRCECLRLEECSLVGDERPNVDLDKQE
ncbi:MAG: MerR family transcriptional regulator [Rubrobacteraceae bacterium]|jgi:MerR family redox-sensitive transcriptional activator SoxR|nr:MerR family transcriptional regulator [Rubrobacteraceae bacterium]